MREIKPERQRERFELASSYSTGSNSVECVYSSVLAVDITRRTNGFLYATGAWWQD